MAKPYVVVYKDRRGRYRYRRIAKNGQVTQTAGQGYASRSGARRAARRDCPALLVVSR